jgi:hypothetical protein
MPSESNDIIFFTPILTPLMGEPTHASLQLLQRELNANALQIHSRCRGGLHGHLAQLISAKEYTLISETAFIPADDPGVQEPHALGATSAQIFAANTFHNNTCDDFTTYCKTQVTLKSQLLAAVDDAFVNELNDPLWSYGQLTALQLLTHLRDTYGWITPD